MKFTEEQAREALRSELTNKGRKSLAMSDRTLASQTEKLINVFAKLKEVESIDEMGLPDFVGIAVEILGDTNDNVRKDNSDFVRNWKKDHPDTDPTNPTAPEPKPTESPEMKALMERIAALEKDKEESNLRASIAQKRSDLTAKLKEKGVKDEKWLDKYLSKVNINADTDVDAEVEDTLSLYNLNKANGGNPVPPANPNGGAQNESRYSSAIKAAAELAKSNREAGIVITE